MSALLKNVMLCYNGGLLKNVMLCYNGGFLVFGGLKGIPPNGQSFSHPPHLKYIATYTENTKNPKNPW